MTTEIYVFFTAVLLVQLVTLAVLLRGRLPTVFEPVAAPGKNTDTIIVDTCALIDGRIQDLLSAGFITGQLYIPRRVIEELQYLADHGDAHKRSRARFGLDVVQRLQDTAKSQVAVLERGQDSEAEVDDLLISLTKTYQASLYTTDYNLNKVARIHDVSVLNVNELAQALRPIHLPGESVTVKIVQKGEGPAQGVGYLEDGTMTVVENAANRIGQQITGEVERMLQTEAGKMIFARAGKRGDQGNGGPKTHRSGQPNRGKQRQKT